MRIATVPRQLVLLVFLTGTACFAETTAWEAVNRIADLRTERTVKEGTRAAMQLMLHIASDPRQDCRLRSAAVNSLLWGGFAEARPILKKLADSLSKEPLSQQDQCQLRSEVRDVEATLSYYEAKTPEAQYGILTNLALGGGPNVSWWVERELAKRGDETVLTESLRRGEADSDYGRFIKEKLALVRLAKQNPAAWTNTMRQIAAVELVPQRWAFSSKEDHETYKTAEKEAAERAQPYLKKVGTLSSEFQRWAYLKLEWDRLTEASYLRTLQRLLEENVLTTNDVQQCTVPEIKEVVDKYILGTNRPPWQVYGDP